LVSIAALGQSSATAASSSSATGAGSIEGRLSRITTILQEREAQFPRQGSEFGVHGLQPIARGAWGNGRGGAWGNGGSRFANARGPGGFYNVRPGGGWLNGGWRDGGRFYNYRY
jgi:rSAM-associated Gly-rich repeat protein